MYDTLQTPGDQPPGDAQAHAPALPILTVRSVVDQAGSAIRRALPATFWCEAQVVAVQEKATGYRLELVDPGSHDTAAAARLHGFLSSRARAAISEELGFGFDPASLMDTCVLLKASVRWHPAHHLSLSIVGLNPAFGESLLKLHVDRLRAAFQQAGIFDAQQRLARPKDVMGLAVIAPDGSAGLGDIEDDLRRWEAAGIASVHWISAVFEGPKAAASISEGLNHCAALAAAGQIDVVLVARGGGHKAGLIAASAESVVRAVLALPVPVVVGVGHARDLSLLDEAAWLSCSTPTKAIAVVRDLFARPAMAAVGHWAMVTGRLQDHLERRMQPKLEQHRERLITAGRSLVAGEIAAVEGTRTAIEFERAGLVVQMRQRRFELDDIATRLVGNARMYPVTEQARIGDLYGGLATAVRSQLGKAAELIERLPAQSDLDRLLAGQRNSLDRLFERVQESLQRHIAGTAAELASTFANLRVLDVDEMLGHGLALAVRPDGKLLRSAAEAAEQAHFSLLFRDGSVAVAPDSSTNATIH